MSFQPLLRRSSVLVSALAAGLALTVTSCSHLTPLGPDQNPPVAKRVAVPVTMPALPSHLGSPIVLQVMRSRPAPAAGRCPAGWVTLPGPGSAGTCYRKLGTPVTITSASLSSVFPQGQPASYGFMVVVPAAETPAVTAAVKQAYDARGALAVNVAGRTWSAPQVLSPFSGQQLQITLPTRSQALQLYRILVPPG